MAATLTCEVLTVRMTKRKTSEIQTQPGLSKNDTKPLQNQISQKEYNEAYNFKISEQSIWLKLKNIEDDIFKI